MSRYRENIAHRNDLFRRLQQGDARLEQGHEFMLNGAAYSVESVTPEQITLAYELCPNSGITRFLPAMSHIDTWQWLCSAAAVPSGGQLARAARAKSAAHHYGWDAGERMLEIDAHRTDLDAWNDGGAADVADLLSSSIGVQADYAGGNANCEEDSASVFTAEPVPMFVAMHLSEYIAEEQLQWEVSYR